MTTDFKQFYQSLDRRERQSFAKRAGYSPEYIRIHLIRGTKTPTLGGLTNLANASDGAFTPVELFSWFVMANEVARKHGAYRGPGVTKRSQNARSVRRAPRSRG